MTTYTFKPGHDINSPTAWEPSGVPTEEDAVVFPVREYPVDKTPTVHPRVKPMQDDEEQENRT